MNEHDFSSGELPDQLRRFFRDVYAPVEPSSDMWKKLAAQLEVAQPQMKGALTTMQPPARRSAMPDSTPHPGRTRPWLGSAAAVLLTGIIILASVVLFHAFRPQSGVTPPVRRIATPQPHAGVPATPVATLGPQSKYVSNIVTAQGVSTDYVPVNETSHFTVGQTVNVICTVGGLAEGQKHTVSIHWLYDGVNLDLPLVVGKTAEQVTQDQVVYFSLSYPSAGIGTAEIFLDLPSTDNGDQPNDPYLAGSISFSVSAANGASAAGTATLP